MPNFVSGGAMAGNALQQFLIQRELENRQRMLDELTQQRQGEQDAIRNRELTLREQEAAREAERQARLDAQAEEQRQAALRAQGNVTATRGMMADAMTQPESLTDKGTLSPTAAKTIGIMAYRENMEAPEEVDRILNPNRRLVKRSGPGGKPVQQLVTDDELIAGVEEYQEPDTPNTGSWASAGSGLLFNTRTGEFREAPQGAGGGKGTGGDAAEEYGLQTADRVIAAIDGVVPKINDRTAGIVGNATTRLGINQEGIDVSAELQTVAGNIAFNALQQMRNASKTGGALGSVAQEELRLLQSVEGSLRQDQSPANLKAQLQKVRESMERFKAAQAKHGGGTDAEGWTVINGARVRRKPRP